MHKPLKTKGYELDTIFALATAQGKSGIAVIRVSGSGARDSCELIAGFSPKGRTSRLSKLRNEGGALIDEALVLFFEKDASFTGEDVVEFQCHGSTAVVASLLRLLADRPGHRLAEPGEFTRRALENGRLDLARVEGLADLIDAETEAQRQQAVRIFSGALGKKADRWRTDLIRAAALLEATIDFADEDVPVDVHPEVVELLGRVMVELASEIRGGTIAERIRDGFEIAILGPPNAGKSTLLNTLAGREAAITSSIAGTTRDVIEVRMELAGLPVMFLDTAGLRETEDEVEKIGIQRAITRAELADFRLFLMPADEDWTPLVEPRPEDLVVGAKADLRSNLENAISGLTGQGVDRLVKEIEQKLKQQSKGASLAVRERHRIAMTHARDALKSALDALSERQETVELAAEDIRIAVRRLESVIGRVDVESLLGEIFASFCLGK